MNYTDMNGTALEEENLTTPISNLSCPGPQSPEDTALLEMVTYWVEGVAQTALGTMGILGNLISCVILTRREMRNAFNLLLVTLASFDTYYLLGAILESIRKSFDAAPQLQIVLFPHLLYPLHQTSMTGSIFMTVAIAFERYTAVHYPIDYNLTCSDMSAMKRRALQYVMPVAILSLLFNIPKFFEAKTATGEIVKVVGLNATTGMNITEVESYKYITITPMRTNAIYSNYKNWSQLLVLGIIPFSLLVFFNFKIYSDIKKRRHRRMRAITNNLYKKQAENALTSAVAVATTTTAADNAKNNNGVQREQGNGSAPMELIPLKQLPDIAPDVLSSPISSGTSSSAAGGHSSSTTVTDKMKKSPSSRTLKNSNCSVRKARRNRMAQKEQDSGSQEDQAKRQTPPSRLELALPLQQAKRASSLRLPSTENRGARVVSDPASMPCSISQQTLRVPGTDDATSPCSTPRKRSSNPLRALRPRLTRSSPTCPRRRNEDSLAMVFMGIIIIFLVCHLPRIVLHVYELATIHILRACRESQPDNSTSLVTELCVRFSHLLLVFNSATNMIVYCLLSSKFRDECVKTAKRWLGAGYWPGRGRPGITTAQTRLEQSNSGVIYRDS